MSVLCLMGVFNWFKKKKSTNAYTFSDDDRNFSAKMRKIKAETKQIELQCQLEEAKADLEELRESLFESDEEEDNKPQTADAMIMTLLMKAINGTGSSPPNTIHSVSDHQNYSDEQITSVIQRLSKSDLKKLKKINDSDLSNVIRFKVPDINDLALNRAIALIRAF